jgi:hypothetical protein
MRLLSDGTICEWHHLNCFLKRYTVEAAEAPSIKYLLEPSFVVLP